MDANDSYTYPKFRFLMTHVTSEFRPAKNKELHREQIGYCMPFTDVQGMFEYFKAKSLTEPSTWKVEFFRNGLTVTDISYQDDDFHWFTDIEQAMDRNGRGVPLTVEEWRLTAISERLLTKRDKCEIMRLYDGSEEEKLAMEMEGGQV